LSDVLILYPHGYPLHIDIAQSQVAGAGTAMRFELPPHGHNLPLLHTRERKLVIALAGRLRLKSGAATLAELRPGQGVTLEPGTAHRIAQDGAEPSVVGVVLLPGAVEQAFRDIAATVAEQRFVRDTVIALLAKYGVQWETGGDAHPHSIPARPGHELIRELPEPLATMLAGRWERWLRAPTP
jgi:quercetin dioxygenase-like cupin family protein